MSISVKQALNYLEVYIERFRSEYARFTAPYPNGAGYPQILDSPYLRGGIVTCYLGSDGALLVDASEPPYAWDVDGGPALVVDYEPSIQPVCLTSRPDEMRGLYRIVANNPIPPQIWMGNLSGSIGTATTVVGDLTVEVRKYRLTVVELLGRLTFGALQTTLDIHLKLDRDRDLWKYPTIRKLGFCTADREHKRFLRYCQIIGHVDGSAWDKRSAWIRAHVDLQREFASAAVHNSANGTIQIGDGGDVPLSRFRGQLDMLADAIGRFELLLKNQSAEPEATFHKFIVDNPIILDVYGAVESKPRWRYRDGESPLGKSYIEPDFVISYPNNSYRLVEIERASHAVRTGVGHASAPVGHASFQIAEWRDYIARHYESLRYKYPDLANNFKTSIVIGRGGVDNAAEGEMSIHQMSVIRQQFNVDEVLTWDMLLDRARGMLQQLVGVSGTTDG